MTLYFLTMWGLSLVVVIGRGPRILIPVLLVAYLLPFVTFRAGIEAVRRRFEGRPIRDVTPSEDPRPRG
jgi:hypothetical protein